MIILKTTFLPVGYYFCFKKQIHKSQHYALNVSFFSEIIQIQAFYFIKVPPHMFQIPFSFLEAWTFSKLCITKNQVYLDLISRFLSFKNFCILTLPQSKSTEFHYLGRKHAYFSLMKSKGNLICNKQPHHFIYLLYQITFEKPENYHL